MPDMTEAELQTAAGENGVAHEEQNGAAATPAARDYPVATCYEPLEWDWNRTSYKIRKILKELAAQVYADY